MLLAAIEALAACVVSIRYLCVPRGPRMACPAGWGRRPAGRGRGAGAGAGRALRGGIADGAGAGGLDGVWAGGFARPLCCSRWWHDC